MCGILGINEKNQALIDAAAKTIAYRGPDSYGSWADDAVSLGFNRLAIIDLDARANQPMWDTEHSVGIIYNGEIYNFKALKAELTEEGATFRTTSDTEVILCGYKKYGPAFLERLNGMFALAIYDTKEEKLFLARDHAGIKPLLYYHKDGTLIFGSEMKAITTALALKNIIPELDHEAIKTYFGLGYILSPATMYKDVRKVPRGAYLEYDLRTKSIVKIVPFKSPSTSPKSETELFKIIEESILDHLIADVPVGVFFSGGTDSSLIASVLHAHKINLETFSIGVAGRDSDRKYFSEISAKLGLHSHVYDFTTKEFNEVYEPIMSEMDEPNADISIFPTYFVSQKAAERVKVVLSGEGGDELFFGYGRQRAFAKMRGARMRTTLTLLENILLHTPGFKGKGLLFDKLLTFARQPVSALLLAMSPSRDLTTPDAWAASKRAVVAATNDPMYFDRDLYLENDLLRKGDFATSLNSIEGRVPLLDSRIVSAAPAFESAWNPADESKPVLKRMLATYLPHHLVYRPKSGFGISIPRILPDAPQLTRDLDEAIPFLKERGILYARLPKTRAELIGKHTKLCFALISLYRAVKNNEALGV